MNPIKIFASTLFSKKKPQKLNVMSIYDIKIQSLKGEHIELSQFQRKYILFVNVASKCGFTSQYKSLQLLHEKYQDKLQVIGLPCNQFGKQEPGNADVIKSFCDINYGVTFLMTEKIDVKGKAQHPLYQWLTKKVNNGKRDSSVKWNFQKYLIDTNGSLIDSYTSITSPLSSKIIKHLN